MDTLLVSPTRAGAFGESVNRCANSHSNSTFLGRLSERPNQSNKSRLIGLSYLFSSARSGAQPGGGTYSNDTMSRYNSNSLIDSCVSDLDQTVLKEDPGWCVRQIRTIIRTLVNLLSMLFEFYMLAPWNWFCNKLGICGCSLKVLVVFVLILALLSGGGSDYSDQTTQHSDDLHRKNIAINGNTTSTKMFGEGDVLSQCLSHPEIKLLLKGFSDQTQEVSASVKKLETLQSLMQVEMQNIVQEMESFKEDIWAFVLQLPKQEKQELQKDEHLQNRVNRVETVVESLESSLDDIDKTVNAVAYDRNVLDRRLSEMSKQLIEFSSAGVSGQISTLNSLQSSFNKIENTVDSEISRVTSTQEDLNKRVTLIENELSRVVTYQPVDIAEELPLESKGSGLWILRILSSSPTYGEGNWLNSLGRSFVGGERGFVKNADELLKTVEKPGDCWPMEGASGFVEFQLTKPLRLSGVSIFHIPESLSPDLKTAPREFRIKAREISSNSWTDIGKFEYRLNDALTQEFHFLHSGFFEILRLEIISNHGSKEYTCIYQFKVFATNNLG